MQAKRINDNNPETYAVVFDPGDEVIAGLTYFAEEQALNAGRLTAVGAFERATLGYFDTDQKTYLRIPVEEQVEVLSMLGDITREGGKRTVHTHVVLGKRDGSTIGGHILEANVRPTLEVIIEDYPHYLRRRHDEATGLALIDLQADSQDG